MTGVVVVGTGQAGFQVAASLRDLHFDGRIVLIGDEIHHPYQRPPLSKAYLDGKTDEVGLQIRPERFFADKQIDIRVGQRVTAIDRDQRRVSLETGEPLSYDHLVLATGARNRTLPGGGTGLDGVVQLRTLVDAGQLRARLAHAKRAVVLGAGFIGLEFAAVAAKRGLEVTVVEMAPRPMARALSPAMSRFFAQAHEAMGVTFVFGAVVESLAGAEGRVTGVVLADGREIPADLVLVGIGVVPNTELAAEAGLAVANGIVVDDRLTTSDAAISAIGDCAMHPSRFGAGVPLRIESVQNAVDQGRCVAKRIMGQSEPYASVPWFWSDQGPLKLQIAGIASPEDVTVLRGDPDASQFSVFCFAGSSLRAVESVNRPADHMSARRLLALGRNPTPEQAADPAFDLKGFAQGAG